MSIKFDPHLIRSQKTFLYDFIYLDYRTSIFLLKELKRKSYLSFGMKS